MEENKAFKKLKDKKGFTLVELIVVLVILAILAALLVPALTGYIDKAKEKSIIAETRQVVVAAQTLGDEVYAKNDVGSGVKFAAAAGDDVDVTFADVADLGEVTEGNIKAIEWNDGKISHVQYKKDNKTCDYYAEESTATGSTHDAGYTVS